MKTAFFASVFFGLVTSASAFAQCDMSDPTCMPAVEKPKSVVNEVKVEIEPMHFNDLLKNARSALDAYVAEESIPAIKDEEFFI